MNPSRFVRSLNISYWLFYPHELGHWTVVRLWTSEAEIVPIPAEKLRSRIQIAAAEVQAPIPEDVPTIMIRLAAVGPMLMWAIISFGVVTQTTLRSWSPEFLATYLAFAIPGALSVDDVNTVFKANQTKEAGGLGTKYVELSEINIPWWVYIVWVSVLITWVFYLNVLLRHIA